MSKRDFVRLTSAGFAACACRADGGPNIKPQLLFGVCTGPDNAAKLRQIGYDFVEGPVNMYLKPALSDSDFAPEMEKIICGPLPIRAVNGFFPAGFRLTGPDADHAAALAYAVRVCRRADAAGILFVVLGSGAARRVPEGFDLQEGRSQFIEFCRKLGDGIKDCKVTVVLEPLNKAESNLLHLVREGVDYVDEIDNPRVQLLADFFHMRREKEHPDSIRLADTRLRHCHIAEDAGRMAPGTSGEDFGAFFRALRDIGYSGGVSCECGWLQDNLEAAWERALDTMRAQAGA